MIMHGFDFCDHVVAIDVHPRLAAREAGAYPFIAKSRVVAEEEGISLVKKVGLAAGHGHHLSCN